MVKGDTDYILRTGGLMLLVAAGSGICAIRAAFLSATSAPASAGICGARSSAQVSSFSLHEFDKLGTATLITRTTNDINQVQQVLLLIMRMMITAPLMAIGGIILAVSKDAPLTLVLVVAIPILVVAIILIATRAVPLFRALQLKLDRLNLVLREELTGIRVIRAFNRTDYERQRFDEANGDLTDDRDQGQPHHERLVPDRDAGHEPHLHRHHLVWRPAHRRRRDAGGLADRLHAVCRCRSCSRC